MKRTNILLVMLLWVASHTHAQLVQEHETAVVYYMPKTELVINIDYKCVEQEPGIFYQYAQRYLGATNIITEKKTTYQLTNLDLTTTTNADTKRAYKVTPQKGYNLQLLSLTTDGRLLGYNTNILAQVETEVRNKETKENKKNIQLMPLLEEHFMAGSIAKMAEGAAKQIYRIRETRLNILGGDVEHVPADGAAMQLVLNELDKQEKALVALFVGTTNVQTHTHQLQYCPVDSKEKEVICRFSKHTGIVNKNDLSGEPLYLSIAANKQALQTHIEYAKGIVPSQIYYNLPGSAQVHLQYQSLNILDNITVAQFGVAIPLAQDLLTSNPKHSIYINPETGNILSIQQ